jgi:hypothetical protein
MPFARRLFDKFVAAWNEGRVPARISGMSEKELRRADESHKRTAHTWSFALSERDREKLDDTTHAVGDATTSEAAAALLVAGAGMRAGAGVGASSAGSGRTGAHPAPAIGSTAGAADRRVGAVGASSSSAASAAPTERRVVGPARPPGR